MPNIDGEVGKSPVPPINKVCPGAHSYSPDYPNGISAWFKYTVGKNLSDPDG